jgi:hypothetical protein
MTAWPARESRRPADGDVARLVAWVCQGDVAEWRQDILEEHLSELEPLWRRRISTAKAATADAVALKRCDARIDANTDALALADDCAWPLLENALGVGDPALAAAATMAADAFPFR